MQVRGVYSLKDDVVTFEPIWWALEEPIKPSIFHVYTEVWHPSLPFTKYSRKVG